MHQGRVLPACAGVILWAYYQGKHTQCAPRMCGGDPPRKVLVRGGLVVLPACAGVILHHP